MKSISKGFVSKHLNNFSIDNTNLFKINNFDRTEFQHINRTLISELVSELFNHANSKEFFNYISNLLISTLKEYEKYFVNDVNSDVEAGEVEKIENKDINLIKPICDSRNDYLGILEDIDNVLSNYSEMTHIQRIDFCNSQRHFMKLYLKQVIMEMKKS